MFLYRNQVGQVYWISDDSAILVSVINGARIVTAPASENLVAGNFVNLFDNAGTINVRKANATNNTKPADGFVLNNVTSPANATVYLISSKNTALSGLVVGAYYWLSTTSGLITATEPVAIGNIQQRLGKAISATELIFENQEYNDVTASSSGVTRGFVLAMASAL